MKDFRQLKVWQLAHELVLATYRATRKFPADERFGLTSQIRRCCVSIPANIAEGCGRRGNGEFQRFLQIASGSASELEYHFLLANDLGFLPTESHADIARSLTSIRKMLSALISRVEDERLNSAH